MFIAILPNTDAIFFQRRNFQHTCTDGVYHFLYSKHNFLTL